MEVILREHVDNLGRRGEVVKVADGYARNYLLPRKLALLVTDGNKQQIERERAKFDAREQEEKKVADAMAARLADVEIQISRKVGETEALYGSVTSADVSDALTAKGFEIDRRKLHLAEPIKKLGDYEIPLRLHREVTVQIKLKVVAEGATEVRREKLEVRNRRRTQRATELGRTTAKVGARFFVPVFSCTFSFDVLTSNFFPPSTS